MPVFCSLGADGHTEPGSAISSSATASCHSDTTIPIPRFPVRDPATRGRTPQFSFPRPQSAIPRPKSAIPMSAIFNPLSAIRSPHARDRNDCAIPKPAPQSPVLNPQSPVRDSQSPDRSPQSPSPQSPIPRCECEGLAGGDFDTPLPGPQKEAPRMQKSSRHIYIYI